MMIVCLCIFAVGLLFSLCCFAMSFYTLILVTSNAGKMTSTEIDKLIASKVEELIIPLEPGIYMPRKDMVTGETGYHKMEELFDDSDKQHEAILQSLLKVTGDNGHS
jgi:hypothetical protein